MYIVFEGVQGSGKTTQAKRLHAHLKVNFPGLNLLITREPGGHEISEAIRKLVQGTKFSENMHPATDAYLYASARAESLRKVVIPALETGVLVISDRSFVTSLAIQGHAQGFGLERILEINSIAIENAIPDLVVFINISPDIAHKRTFDGQGDKFENENLDFMHRVALGYELASKLPIFEKKWIDIEGTGTEDEVFERLLGAVSPKIEQLVISSVPS